MSPHRRQGARPKPGACFQRKPRPVAVLDTNIILDTHSCHDLTSKIDELHPMLGDGALDDEAVTFRLERARESTLLAIHLHRAGATTFGLQSEMVRILARNAPPSELARKFETAFTTVFIWFVKDRLLSGWNHTVPKKPGTEAGNAADKALVAAAKERGVPLISNEGYSHTGAVDDTKLIRRCAREEQVAVLLPREYYGGKINEAELIEGFLMKFSRLAPSYIEERRKRFGGDGTEELLKAVFGLYRLILRGEAEGRNDVRVSLAALRGTS